MNELILFSCDFFFSIKKTTLLQYFRVRVSGEHIGVVFGTGVYVYFAHTNGFFLRLFIVEANFAY